MCKIRKPPPTEGEDRLIPFLSSLVAEDLSPKTVDGYRQDLLAFRRWYRESWVTDLRWEELGSNDLIPGKLVELASLLGHESLDTTALYTRPSIDDLAEDLERSRLNVCG